jgi:hypothetical protein
VWRVRSSVCPLPSHPTQVPPALDELPDLVVQIVCGAVDGLAADGDPVSTFRRLLALGRLLRKCGQPARELVLNLEMEGVIREGGVKQGGDALRLAREILTLLGKA